MSSRLTISQIAASVVVVVAAIVPMVIAILAIAIMVLLAFPIIVGASLVEMVILWRRSKKMPIPAWMVAENYKLANKFAQKGTVKHLALRLGFMPNDEKDAEDLIRDVCEECDMWRSKYMLLKKYGMD